MAPSCSDNREPTVQVTEHVVQSCACPGVVYCTHGNLHPKERSSLKGIHLISCTYYRLIQRYGIDSVLESTVADVKCLEEVNALTHQPYAYVIN